MSYYISEAAVKELHDFQQTLLSAVGYHLISADTAKKQYWEKLRAVIAESYVHTDSSSRNIPIQCPGCDRISVVASDVRVFECVCSPHEIRFVSSCRTIGEDRTPESMLRQIKPNTEIQSL